MNYRLITPCMQYQQSYFSYIEELGDEERYPMPMDLQHQDFPALLKTLEDYAAGVNLPDGIIANSTYWLVEDETLLGVSNLRHVLTAQLRHAGGHIGLGIRPGARGQGLSSFLLRETLVKAEEMGINEVHIHCHSHNIPSARMIISCGGILHSQWAADDPEESISRYIINIGQEA